MPRSIVPTSAFVVGALALAFALVVPHVPTATAATDRVLVISTSSARPQVSFAQFDGNPAKVFDIDGNGRLEIIAQNDNQWVYVFDSMTGALLFQAKTTFPSGWGARSFNGPEVAVVTDGGSVRLIVANSAAYITSFRFDAAGSSPTIFKFHKEWETRLDDCHDNPGMDAKPVLADLDKDGRLEILGATEERGLVALRNDGSTYWVNCLSGGNAEPTVGDLNGDGWPDVVHVSDGGVVAALNGRTGGWMWGYDAKRTFNLGSGSMPVGATVAQLDGSGGLDVVVGARDSHDAANVDKNHALLLALSGSGKLLWGRQHPEANPLTYTHPIVADADRDGKPEVYWADWNTMGHKPPWDEEDAWQRTGPANFYRYDQWGNLVWRQVLDSWWHNKDLAIADVDGDGQQEVLANGPSGGNDGIWYLNVKTGAKEAFVSASPYTVSRGPVVADLWGTGTMQFVLEAGKQILVYDTRQPYSSVWPHLPYVSLAAGGSEPTLTTTPPPDPTGVPDVGFGATFELSSPGEWWQQVDVDADDGRDVVDVDIRIDGGPWQGMTLRSWGHWTSGYHTDAGARVEFLARDAAGAAVQSAPFEWLDGTLEQRGIAAGGSGFAASFEPRAVGNDWWVEVDVDSASTITAVDARLDGGAWQSLGKTSWGTWAKTIHAPDGTKVEFRAADAAGAHVLSAAYTWA